MSSLPTPPRLGLRVPLPPPPKEGAAAGERDGLVQGDVLEGRYQIEDRIGEGGVGFVYRALQLKLHRRVAVKLLQRDMVGDEELRPRFEREAITLAALSHPNIVSIQDYGMVRGAPFLVMEFLEGRTLREIMDVEGALAPLRALQITRQILHALVYAHELGIVHRDLKPANLIVQPLPAYEHVKVLDFGLAKLLPGSYLDRGVQLSRVGFTFGTPPYMSPEHATGGNVDGRSDLYSVGILLFEMLAGGKPFDGELHEVIRHHLSTPVPKLADRRAELTGRDDLQLIIDRCLAKSREQRFQTALELVRAVDEAITNCARPAALAVQVPAPDAAEAQGPLEVSREARALAVGSQRLARATWQWFLLAALPWLKERTANLRGSVAQRAAGLRGSLGQVGQKTQEAARDSWRAAKPALTQAKEQIAKVAEDAKAKLRPSKAPPPIEPGSQEGPSATAPTAFGAREVDRSMGDDMTNVLPAPARSVAPAAPAPARSEASRSIAEDATLDMDAHQKKQRDPDATMVDES